MQSQSHFKCEFLSMNSCILLEWILNTMHLPWCWEYICKRITLRELKRWRQAYKNFKSRNLSFEDIYYNNNWIPMISWENATQSCNISAEDIISSEFPFIYSCCTNPTMEFFNLFEYQSNIQLITKMICSDYIDYNDCIHFIEKSSYCFLCKNENITLDLIKSLNLQNYDIYNALAYNHMSSLKLQKWYKKLFSEIVKEIQYYI